jgi:WD40 repeat protein
MRFFLRKHTAAVNDVCVDPRGRWVATVSDDESALVWDASTGQVHCSLKGGAAAVSAKRTCYFDADGNLLATGCGSGAIELWEVKRENSGGGGGGGGGVPTTNELGPSWPCFRAVENAHTAAVNALAWVRRRGCKTLLSVGDDKAVRWWECSTAHCAKTAEFPLRAAGNAVAASEVRVVVHCVVEMLLAFASRHHM